MARLNAYALVNPIGGLNIENEIDINLKAPIQLSAFFIPDLLKQKESALVNVSSGLGFVPIAAMPVYCATKAAMHSIRYVFKEAGL